MLAGFSALDAAGKLLHVDQHRAPQDKWIGQHRRFGHQK
jgi:hypothetical protein